MSQVTPLNRTWLRTHPLPDPFATEDKEGRGRLLVIGGSARVPGAVLLAGKAALHAGAGKLHVATARPVAQSLAITLPEAMVSPLPVNAKGELTTVPAAIIKECTQTDALLIGPGMAPGRSTDTLVTQLLRKLSSGCVLDAGAIGKGLLSRPDSLPCIVTPHAGEMAVATGLPREEIEKNALQVARSFAQEYGCIVVMKGVPTYIASTQGTVLRFQAAAPGLGTSGSGDVLAGLITGLLARGAQPLAAAAWGVWLHGQAGLALGKREGPVGYLARDISALVPGLMQAVSARSKR